MNTNFLERFSKYPQILPDKLFIADIQSDGRMDMINLKALFSQFWYAITNVLQMYRYPVKCLAFLNLEKPLSLYYSIFGQTSNTRRPLSATNNLKSEITDVNCHGGGQSSIILLRHCLLIFPLSSLQLSSRHFQFVTSYRTHSQLMNYSVNKNSSFSLHVWNACT